MLGKTIRHYTIVEKIGQGGMGEVYRATDSRLGKSVAFKFLPEATAQDEIARSRLLREARSAAALDHPYICQVYEVGEVDGADYIVMEYVSGQTLQQELQERRLPVGDCLRIASEIAEALDKAQQKGIVHRDLKPANIMVTPEGHVKVMDFGLAKRVDRQEGSLEEVTRQLTREGAVVGTIPYMSPEQLKGEQVDSRSDIFSFGVILYEMLAGQHPFRKSDAMATAGSILQEEPAPVGMLREGLSPLVQYMVRKTLAKDPNKRYQSAKEIYTDLMAVLQDSGPVDVVTPPAHPGSWSVPVWLVIPALILALLGGWALQPESREEPAPEEFRSKITVPPGMRITYPVHSGSPLALSPDGKMLAFVLGAASPIDHDSPLSQWDASLSRDQNQIFVQRFGEWSARPIPGTEKTRSFTFSPDSEWIAFSTGPTDQGEFAIKRVRISGQDLETICQTGVQSLASDPCRPHGGIAWGDNDRIILSPYRGSLQTWPVPATGEGPREILSLETTDSATIWQDIHTPSWLPEGRGLLFTQSRGTLDLTIGEVQTYLMVPGSEKAQMLIDRAVDARYIDPGYIVFARNGDLWAIRFDLEELQTRGHPTLVLEGVNQASRTGTDGTETGVAHFSVSGDGKLAYLAGGTWPSQAYRFGNLEYYWTMPGGQETRVDLPPRRYLRPRILPGGQFVAQDPSGYGLYLGDEERGTWTDLRVDLVAGFALGPGQDEITYSRWGLDTAIYKRTIGAEPETEVKIADPGHFSFPVEWTPDGEKLVYLASTGRFEIWMFDNGKSQRLIQDTSKESFLYSPALSPDGEWIAYARRGLGTGSAAEVFVQPFPGPGIPIPISTGGGSNPIWTADGDEIIYLSDESFLSVSLRMSRGKPDPTRPRELFRGPFVGGAPVRGWDLSKEDRRFLVARRLPVDPEETAELLDRYFPTEIRIIQNWVRTLEEKFREGN